MGYYLAFRRKEILAHAITRMNFDDILLVSEISQNINTEYLLHAQQSQSKHNKGHKNT